MDGEQPGRIFQIGVYTVAEICWSEMPIII
jgi:hypothetical protein